MSSDLPSNDRYTTFINQVYAIGVVAEELVTIELTQLSDNRVEIVSIWSEVERRAGHGSAALTGIIAIADELGVDIELTCYPMAYDTHARELAGENEADLDRYDDLNDQHLELNELQAWYARHGFTVLQAGDNPVMVRPPAPALRLQP